MHKLILKLIIAGLFVTTGSAAIVQTNAHATNETTLTGSSTDLASQGTIARTAGSAFGINNGDPNELVSGLTGSGEGVFHSSGSNGNHFPAEYTISLDTSSNPDGYDIEEISSIAGWRENGQTLANQKIEILISTTSNNAFTSIGTFENIPFSNTTGASASKIALTDSSGLIETKVDQIRIRVLNHGTHTGSAQGTVFKEFDVLGTPSSKTSPSPSPLSVNSVTPYTVIQRDENDLGSVPISGSVSGSIDRIEARTVTPSQPSSDLGNIWFIGDSITQSNADGDSNGSPRKSHYSLLTAAGYNFTYTGHFTANIDGLPNTGSTASTNLYHYHSGVSGSTIGNNSNGRTNMTNSIPQWWNSGRLASRKPNIVLIMLGTNDIDLNDDITNAPARMKNLINTILTQAGTSPPSIFISQIPPNLGSATEDQNVVTYNNGLSNIVSELKSEGKDVTLVDNYTPIKANTGLLMRDSLHTNAAGNSVLAQQWFNSIESHLNANSGTPSDWQTITTTTSSSTFNGSLNNIPAGGWYDLQVRTIVNGSQKEITTINKIGIGDVFIVGGQSNSASHGESPINPTEDRASVRTSLTNNTWQKLADPLPIASGTGGSPWSRFVGPYVAATNVPVGFVAFGEGGTPSNRWVPSANDLYPRIQQAIQSFPTNGFKAVLWHQGEADSKGTTSYNDYVSRFQTTISQARTDAGWNFPWYFSEVSFSPKATIIEEIPITSAQQTLANNDPLIFLGADTDDFHLEGKLIDQVHFNAAGLQEHSEQWLALLTGNPQPNIKNSNFEANPPLNDGSLTSVNISNDSSPSLIGWQIRSANGQSAADGTNGYLNPTATHYTSAFDSNNGGVLSNMNGKHLATLNNGSPGNNLFQALRTRLEPNTKYSLTAAFGHRNSGTFGEAKLELLAAGQILASSNVTSADLDTDAFTPITLTYTTGNAPDLSAQLAIRITKVNGNSTYLDVDHITLTTGEPTSTEPINWALADGAFASQSSTAHGGVASRAIDGDTNGEYWDLSVTHTAVSANSWWQVNLGNDRPIDEITLYNRTDCCPERLSNYRISILDASGNTISSEDFYTTSGFTTLSETWTLPNTVTGRTVRVETIGNSRANFQMLSLAEVEVIGGGNNTTPPITEPTTVNWALESGSLATQSSTAHGGIASRAIDGDTNGEYWDLSVTHTTAGTNSWWQVDLGNDRPIDEIILYNRTDCCPERLSNYRISILNASGNIIASQDFHTTTGFTSLSETWTLPNTMTGRTVRVETIGNSRANFQMLSLAEVQVIGTGNPSTPENPTPIEPVNFATTSNASATQSSTGWGGTADLAIDGNTNGQYFDGSVTHTLVSPNSWWEVNLGNDLPIDEIILFNRTDCCANRLSNYRISILDASRNTIISKDFFTNSGHTLLSETWTLPSTTTGRTVRIETIGNSRAGFEMLSLAEVQVWGSPITGSVASDRQEKRSAPDPKIRPNIPAVEIPVPIDEHIHLLSQNGHSITITHLSSSSEVPTYEWSPNLIDWFDADGIDGPKDGTTVSMKIERIHTHAYSTATPSTPLPRLFIRQSNH